MKIESILIRKGGTKISFGTEGQPGFVEYHFKPDDSGRQVAEVAEPSHVDRLLSIPEGFRIFRGDPEPGPLVSQARAPAPDFGTLELLDKHALSKEYERLYGDLPPAAFSKAKLVEAIRARNTPVEAA